MLFLLDRRQSKVTKTPLELNPPGKGENVETEEKTYSVDLSN